MVADSWQQHFANFKVTRPTLDVHAVSTCPQLPSNLIVMEVGACVSETREGLQGATSKKHFYPR